MNKILIPAIYFTNKINGTSNINGTSPFHGKIVARGKPVQDILSSSQCFNKSIISISPTVTYSQNERNRWQFNDLSYNNIKVICKVYIGGYGGMSLPKPQDTFSSSNPPIIQTTAQIIRI